MIRIEDIDRIINQPDWAPYHGWHDDHRDADGTAAYLPALQQVRSEFAGLIDIINTLDSRKCVLQLGLGATNASHAVWSAMFDYAVTIDRTRCLLGIDQVPNPEKTLITLSGLDSHSPAALSLVSDVAPFDMLFIDAGHTYEDVGFDYHNYFSFVERGGIIAFHDSLPRKGYEEVEVWKFVADLPGITMIGEEVGIAWLKV